MDKITPEKAARRFLNSDCRSAIPEADLAESCERLIQDVAKRSLRRALKLARQFEERSRGGSQVLRLTAYRARARMCHFSGEHGEALKYYLLARRSIRSDPVIVARIDRTLVDVYMYLNDFPKARRHARLAMSRFRKLRRHGDLAQTWVNYGNLLHRLDRHREADKWYRRAADYFEQTDNAAALARCYYNRANVLVQMFEFSDAEPLYERAKEIWTQCGNVLDVCDVRYGLAWVRMLRGEFHRALLELSSCEKTYREVGDPRGEALCALDRAEVYLTLGLFEDARKDAADSERRFARLNLRYERAKASLFRAQASQALGLKREAAQLLRKSRRLFQAERNWGFTGVTHLVSADSSDSQKDRETQLDTARRFFARAHMPFWEAICDLKAATAGIEDSAVRARMRQNKAIQLVPHLYALEQTLDGDRRWQRGDTTGAIDLWRRAADRLDEVRAHLPPVELRSAYGRRHVSPHLRLISAEADRDPLVAAVWSERYKTAGLWSPQPADLTSKEREHVARSLTALAAQVVAVARQVSPSGPRNWRAPAVTHALGRLQKQIRRELLASGSVDMRSIESVETIAGQFRSVSERFPVIQFHLQGDDIFAFVHSHGKTRLARFEGGQKRLGLALERWRFILEVQLLTRSSGHPASLATEMSLWEEFGEWLWRPLGVGKDCSRVLILPEGELANIPWGALVYGGAPLATLHQFMICPSLRHYLAAEKIQTKAKSVEVFKGLADDLRMVDQEITTLISQAGDRAVSYDPVRRESWPSEEDAALWHYSGHSCLREDNPFYSYLILEDGPLFAADFRLKRCRVNLVTLAACRSGEEVALPGDESMGFVRSLLEMGARNVIAGHWPVSDQSTALWMNAFYDKYLFGESILDSARTASMKVRELYPSAYHWAAFSVFGAGCEGGNCVA